VRVPCLALPCLAGRGEPVCGRAEGERRVRQGGAQRRCGVPLVLHGVPRPGAPRRAQEGMPRLLLLLLLHVTPPPQSVAQGGVCVCVRAARYEEKVRCAITLFNIAMTI